jgi:leucyl-tRNA synthetase
MSKSRGNVVNPDEVIDRYGADSFRLYEMFMGPLEAVKPWSTRSIEGVSRFLQRLWSLAIMEDGRINPAIQDISFSSELNTALHRAIREVTDDTENLRFNTAISQMMVFLNLLSDQVAIPKKALEMLVLILSPYAPHISEEIWERLGHEKSLAYEPWPSFDPKALELSETTWVIQVNGKVRARLVLAADADNDQLRKSVLAEENIKKFIEGRPIKQFVVVPKKLVNIVV